MNITEYGNGTIAVHYCKDERPDTYERFVSDVYMYGDFMWLSDGPVYFGNSCAAYAVANAATGCMYYLMWEDFEKLQAGKRVYIPACEYVPELFAA